VFITRGTRHDKEDIRELYNGHGWKDVDLDEGVSFIARDGNVVGAVRLVEVEPQTVVVDNVLVREDKRGQGAGADLMRAAMNSRGGKLYLCCHEERLRFYRDLGFSELPVTELPARVLEYYEKVGDYPTDEGHVHYFLTAR
jgi:N-acetylglutamate synthase-like GNAT family acetyltransferase